MKRSLCVVALFWALAIDLTTHTEAVAGQTLANPDELAVLAKAHAAAELENLIRLQQLESGALSLATSQADRNQDQLLLHLKRGNQILLSDAEECRSNAESSRCDKYLLIAHLSDRNLFLVGHLFSESINYLLIADETGSQTGLRAFPILSPTGEHALVLIMNDNEIGFAVQIWQRNGHLFHLEWEEAPNTGGLYTSYKLLSWPTEDVIHILSETTLDISGDKWPVERRQLTLQRSMNGWHIAENHK